MIRRTLILLPLVLSIAWLFVAESPAEEARPACLLRAHAHNDYQHERPLLDALDQGFNSVEADIFLVGDKLLVAHWYHEINPHRTLESLYLDPLKQRVEAGKGSVHAGEKPFRLLIDIKTDGEKTYAALAKVLAKYDGMLTQVKEGEPKAGAIEVVISGNRPQQMITAESHRFAGIDGRLGDLGGKTPPHLMPLVSDNWKSHFKWNGKGEIPAAEQEKLQRIVAQAHAEGRDIRFWGTPDTLAMWKVLDKCGVDAINTDDLPGLAKYLNAGELSQQN